MKLVLHWNIPYCNLRSWENGRNNEHLLLELCNYTCQIYENLTQSFYCLYNCWLMSSDCFCWIRYAISWTLIGVMFGFRTFSLLTFLIWSFFRKFQKIVVWKTGGSSYFLVNEKQRMRSKSVTADILWNLFREVLEW